MKSIAHKSAFTNYGHGNGVLYFQIILKDPTCLQPCIGNSHFQINPKNVSQILRFCKSMEIHCLGVEMNTDDKESIPTFLSLGSSRRQLAHTYLYAQSDNKVKFADKILSLVQEFFIDFHLHACIWGGSSGHNGVVVFCPFTTKTRQHAQKLACMFQNNFCLLVLCKCQFQYKSF